MDMDESLVDFLLHNVELFSMAIAAAVLVVVGIIGEIVWHGKRYLNRKRTSHISQYEEKATPACNSDADDTMPAQMIEHVDSKMEQFSQRLQTMETTLDFIKNYVIGNS